MATIAICQITQMFVENSGSRGTYVKNIVKSNTKALRYLKLLRCSRCVKFCGNVAPATRSLATKADLSSTNTASTDNDEWRIMFRMPLIGWATAFNRLKLPYGMINGVMLTGAFALEQASQLPPSTGLVVSTIGITSWCTLAICSLFTRNIIGIIYINHNNDRLKLAYVDYWGDRHDVCVELSDVIQESDKSKQVDYFKSICLHSDPKVAYKLFQRFGHIEDPEAFAYIFGD